MPGGAHRGWQPQAGGTRPTGAAAGSMLAPCWLHAGKRTLPLPCGSLVSLPPLKVNSPAQLVLGLLPGLRVLQAAGGTGQQQWEACRHVLATANGVAAGRRLGGGRPCGTTTYTSSPQKPPPHSEVTLSSPSTVAAGWGQSGEAWCQQGPTGGSTGGSVGCRRLRQLRRRIPIPARRDAPFSANSKSAANTHSSRSWPLGPRARPRPGGPPAAAPRPTCCGKSRASGGPG